MGNYVSKIWGNTADTVNSVNTANTTNTNNTNNTNTNTNDTNDSVNKEVLLPEKRIYGWKRDYMSSCDIYHHFDYYSFMTSPIIDLRSSFPPVYDQKPINGTANAIASIHEFEMLRVSHSFAEMKKNESSTRPFVYYSENKPGVAIRDGIEAISKMGIHDIEMRHERIAQDIDYLRQCLCEGMPFVFGFSVYDSFESDSITKTGIMTMPKDTEKLLGGHAVVAVGFNDLKEHFIVRNSWGDKWGDGGYFYMPYNFITNPDMCADFWTITRV